MKAREAIVLERLREAEEGTSRQREGFQALLVKAAAAMEAAGGELAAAEARAAAAEEAAEAERERSHFAIKVGHSPLYSPKRLSCGEVVIYPIFVRCKARVLGGGCGERVQVHWYTMTKQSG